MASSKKNEDAGLRLGPAGPNPLGNGRLRLPTRQEIVLVITKLQKQRGLKLTRGKVELRIKTSLQPRR